MGDKVGVGICSYRRPVAARRLYDRIRETADAEVVACSVDDDVPEVRRYLPLAVDGCVLIHGPCRGVASNKNRLLGLLMEEGCDRIVIIEDDVEILRPGWLDLFTRALDDTGYHHLELLHEDYQEDITNWSTYEGTVIGYAGPRRSGSFMISTRLCVSTVGGYDTVFGRYGCEHIDRAIRAGLSGMCPKVATHVSGAETYLRDTAGRETMTEFEKRVAVNFALMHFNWNPRPPYFRPYTEPYERIQK